MDAAARPELFETAGFRIDAAQRVLLAADGTRVPLTSRAFDLLLYFLRHPGELADKNRLMAAVWPNTVVEENNLNQCIGALRKALGESPGDHRFLVTVPGRGYRFVAPVQFIAGEAEAEATRDDTGSRRWWWLAAPVIALMAALAFFWPRAPQPRPERAIAVLPFENRSVDRENEYLALGIQDEILTLLTRIADLRVASRTSTLKYAPGSVGAPAIGRELGVAYLLTGSVQRAGDIVRVTVTLIDAEADRHLWAQSYERNAKDVFAVESEVAQSVALALQARLTAEERRVIAIPPTANPLAYEYYLRARASAERVTRTEAEIRAAIAAYEAAVRLDPDFAVAWAQLSRRHANFFSLAYDRSDLRVDAARAALENAIRLAPDLVDTQAARGYFLFVVEGDFAAAEAAFLALEARAPQSADAAAGLAAVTRERGQMDRSADYARRVLALDPLNPYRHAVVCQDYATARELELAEKTCGRALELLPGDVGVRALLATIHQARGELEQSRALLSAITPAPGDWRTLRVLSRQFLLDRKPEAAVALLKHYLGTDAESLGTRRGVVRRWLADAQRFAGETANANDSYAAAQKELDAELERQGRNPALIAELMIVQARLGHRAAALDLSQRCLEFGAHPKRQAWAADCALARIQVEQATGEPGSTVSLLRAAESEWGAMPPLTPQLLRLDPELDNLRGRGDFQSLL